MDTIISKYGMIFLGVLVLIFVGTTIASQSALKVMKAQRNEAQADRDKYKNRADEFAATNASCVKSLDNQKRAIEAFETENKTREEKRANLEAQADFMSKPYEQQAARVNLVMLKDSECQNFKTTIAEARK